MNEDQRQAEIFVAKVGRKPSPSGVNDEGETDLHIAVGLNLVMITRSLLDCGADVHAKDNFGNTPLHWTAIKNASEIAELLLKKGAEIHSKNAEGSTPLHRAARYNARATAELLLKKGADVHAKDNAGRKPLHDAARYNAFATAEVLMKHRADVNAKGSGFLRIFKVDISKSPRRPAAGVNVNAKDNFGNTPLHYAASQDARGETAELLLKHGADIHAENKYGNTPLDIADPDSETEDLLYYSGWR